MSWETTVFVLCAAIDPDIAKSEAAVILTDTPHFSGCEDSFCFSDCRAARSFFEDVRDGRAITQGHKGCSLAWSWLGNGLDPSMLAQAIDGGLQRLWRVEAILDFQAVLLLSAQEQGAAGDVAVMRAGCAPMLWEGPRPAPLSAWESWDGWERNGDPDGSWRPLVAEYRDNGDKEEAPADAQDAPAAEGAAAQPCPECCCGGATVGSPNCPACSGTGRVFTFQRA